MDQAPRPPALEPIPERNPALSAVLRVGIFVLLAYLGVNLFPLMMAWITGPTIIVSVLGIFAAAAVANAVCLRIFERGQLADVGLGWTPASRRNLSLGLLGGIGAALVVLLLPMLIRLDYLEPAAGQHFAWPPLLFLSVVLLFGAFGEELLFRGYGFQILVRALGPFAAILPTAILFGLAHSANTGFTFLAFVNTALWGVLFGYAFIRSGDLWLPIGLHFGWNWTLPLLGTNLSGFTMGVTGYSLHWNIGVLWSGGTYGPEGGLLTTAIVVALFFYLHKGPIQHQPAFLLEASTSI